MTLDLSRHAAFQAQCFSTLLRSWLTEASKSPSSPFCPGGFSCPTFRSAPHTALGRLLLLCNGYLHFAPEGFCGVQLVKMSLCRSISLTDECQRLVQWCPLLQREQQVRPRIQTPEIFILTDTLFGNPVKGSMINVSIKANTAELLDLVG